MNPIGRFITKESEGLQQKGSVILSSVMRSALLSKFLECIDVTNELWSIWPTVLHKYFPRIPFGVNINPNGIRKRPKRKRAQQTISDDYDMPAVEGDYIDMCKWNGITIICQLHIYPQYLQNGRGYIKFFAAKNKFSAAILRDFVVVLRGESSKLRSHNLETCFWRFQTSGSCNAVRSFPRPHRSFDDVFIDPKVQDTLLTSLNNFVNNKDWYKKHHLPYHYGILLYGPAGTGKSSIIQALMTEFKCDMIVVAASEVHRAFDTNDYDSWLLNNDDGYVRVIVVEDIDCAAFVNERSVEVSRDDKGNAMMKSSQEILGEVLNFMDGMGSPEDVIYIFTTNHEEKLDPALVRPGRIDLSLKIDYVSDQAFDRFLMHHFGRHLPDGRTVNQQITFAKIQTELTGKATYDDLVKEYTHEKIDIPSHDVNRGEKNL